jgi:hypothetical protein
MPGHGRDAAIDLKSLLAPYPSDVNRGPMSTRVGSVKNNDPALIDWFAVSERRCGLQRPVIR